MTLGSGASPLNQNFNISTKFPTKQYSLNSFYEHKALQPKYFYPADTLGTYTAFLVNNREPQMVLKFRKIIYYRNQTK